jgi:glutathione synthase
MSLRLGFLCDPFASLRPGRDSTLEMLAEALLRGHEAFVFEQRDLRASREGAWALATSIRSTAREGLAPAGVRLLPLSELDAVLLRKDPPVDVQFLHATLLTDLAGGPLLLNDPAALRDCNEKLFALQFPDLVPDTAVASDPAALRERIEAWPEGAMLKPLDGHGGRGVVVTSRQDRNLGALLEIYTAHGTRPALAQAYLPEVRRGDKRILVVDGEPQGVFARLPPADGHRCNLAAGGRAAPAELTDADRAICRRVAPALHERGLHFVGLDVIGRHLIEINVTSPGGIVDAAQHGGARVAAAIVDFIERQRGNLSCRVSAAS